MGWVVGGGEGNALMPSYHLLLFLNYYFFSSHVHSHIICSISVVPSAVDPGRGLRGLFAPIFHTLIHLQ